MRTPIPVPPEKYFQVKTASNVQTFLMPNRILSAKSYLTANAFARKTIHGTKEVSDASQNK